MEDPETNQKNQAKAGRPDHKNKDQDELEDRGIRKEINLKLVNGPKIKKYDNVKIPSIYLDPESGKKYQLIDGTLRHIEG